MIPIWCALAGAIFASIGSLYLSLVMGLKACPLCFYQRTFAYALAAVLGVGVVNLSEPASILLFAFPLIVGGFGVALFHSFMVWSKTLECPAGVANFRSAPEQSLIVFSLILVCFIEGFREQWTSPSLSPLGIVSGLMLGAISVYGSICANPMPPKPTAPYPADQRLETCRFAYKS
jgi:hypothetical protein